MEHMLLYSNKETYKCVFALMLCIYLLSSCAVDKVYEFQPVEGYYVRKGNRLQWSEGLPEHPQSQVFHFTAPPEAVSLRLKAHQRLNGEWKSLLEGGISIGEERQPISQMIGKLCIEPSGKSIQIIIDCGGQTEYTVEPEISFQKKALGACFLDISQKIELNKELLICMVSCDGYLQDGETPMMLTDDVGDMSIQEGTVVITVTFFDSESRTSPEENQFAER